MINSPQAWSARHNNTSQWVRMDLGDSKDIRGVQIQGRKDSNQWVTKFKVSYSINGSNYTLVDNGKIFTGSNDRNTINNVLFNSNVKARYVRIHPQTWYRHISMRCGVILYTNIENKFKRKNYKF